MTAAIYEASPIKRDRATKAEVEQRRPQRKSPATKADAAAPAPKTPKRTPQRRTRTAEIRAQASTQG
jgi:hypothetical protein